MPKSLILLDTDKVKSYVFATGNLKEIRGASSLLEHLNRAKTEQHLKSLFGLKDEDLIYAAGGSVMAIFPGDIVQAKQAIVAIQKLYAEETGTASISGAVLPLPDNYQTSDENFGHLARLAAQKLRQVKDEIAPPLRLPLAPWFRNCSSCGLNPAEYRLEEEIGFVCESCQKKRQASHRPDPRKKKGQRSNFWDEFRSKINQPEIWGQIDETVAVDADNNDFLPENFSDIGEVASPSGYIGFIYADGNGMGEVIRHLKTQKGLEQFSTKVDILTRDVTYKALHIYAQKPRQGKTREIAPFEILLVGGDDLMVVTAADLALPVAVKIAEEFEARSGPEVVAGLSLPAPITKLSLSVGVVLAHASYPIPAMADLASALLSSAKKESTRQSGANSSGPSTLDFMVVTAASSRDLDWVRDEGLTQKSFIYSSTYPCTLTQRPYTVTEFKKLYSFVDEFKRENFSNSQLQNLYDSLFTSFNTASFSTITALARLPIKSRGILKTFLEDFQLNHPHPWRLDNGPGELAHYSTALGDLVEIYRFASKSL